MYHTKAAIDSSQAKAEPSPVIPAQAGILYMTEGDSYLRRNDNWAQSHCEGVERPRQSCLGVV